MDTAIFLAQRCRCCGCQSVENTSHKLKNNLYDMPILVVLFSVHMGIGYLVQLALLYEMLATKKNVCEGEKILFSCAHT